MTVRHLTLSAIILAAGEGSRMGFPKALLRYPDGVNFGSRLATVFHEAGCNPVILVVNDRFELSTNEKGPSKIVVNPDPSAGRSYSIRLGLDHIPEGDGCFIQNVDNPFLDPELLFTLARNIEPNRFVVPVFNDLRGHPVLLGSDLVASLRSAPGCPDFREFLRNFEPFEVPWNDERILLNINTTVDYDNFINPEKN